MPYAAKATIEHEFNIDQLDIWLTFRLPMKICSDPINNPTVFDVKPPNDKWYVELDEAEAEINASEWLDQHTMHLTIENVAANPGKVTVSYLGPDTLLRTTWDKQWEPWADIVSTDLTYTLWKAGMIILWSGEVYDIPSGWALCDGANGTPCLVDQFVMAGGGMYNPGQTGGSFAHTHSASHAHTHTHATGTGLASGTNKNITTGNPSTNTVEVMSADHTPCYYALAYIMKL
jgi:hypothetical protein